jgi:protein-S-isoprenylcysteine O-methyltransferase Ste14
MANQTRSSSLVSLLGFVLVLVFLTYLSSLPLDRLQLIRLSASGVLAILLVAWVGRLLLDARPTQARAEWVSVFAHFAWMLLFGSSVVAVVRLCLDWRIWRIPLPAEIGLALAVLTGFIAILAVGNLALRGLGAPFAVALSRRLAVDWLYGWTRNPMVLSVLSFLLAVGLWLRSGVFLLWVLALATPVMWFFLVVFEERELEIRFGEAYLEYKARTPRLWPRKPRRE